MSQAKRKSRTASCSYQRVTRALFPQRTLKAKIDSWAHGTTDAQVFEAFLKAIGFKPNHKHPPDPFSNRYLRELDKETKTTFIVFTLPGGSMVIFKEDGTFQEWA